MGDQPTPGDYWASATAAEVQRRLAESSVTEEQAKAACANVPSHQEFCVRDVLATGDLDLADADAYVY